jgi:single-stranded-DNA-specific exonuclease
LLVPAARVSEVRSMGEDGQHARFTLSNGGGRARAVAFRTAARTLPASQDERHDAAVRLELNEWNGIVEPRLVLRALCPTERATCALARPEQPFLEAFERALEPSPPPKPPPGLRMLRDRRGEGFAGVVGDLISSGERVLVLCADVSRRREGLESLVAGIAARVRMEDGRPCEQVAIACWDELEAERALAQPYDHVVALDPPAWPGGEALLANASGSGFAHLAWSESEVEFALSVARRSLDMRGELVALYKELRAAGAVAGEQLAAALEGSGAHPRSPEHAARLVTVLSEVGLVAIEPGPSLRMLEAHRTALERSPTYMKALERYAMARAYLERASRAA